MDTNFKVKKTVQAVQPNSLYGPRVYLLYQSFWTLFSTSCLVLDSSAKFHCQPASYVTLFFSHVRELS